LQAAGSAVPVAALLADRERARIACKTSRPARTLNHKRDTTRAARAYHRCHCLWSRAPSLFRFWPSFWLRFGAHVRSHVCSDARHRLGENRALRGGQSDKVSQ